VSDAERPEDGEHPDGCDLPDETFEDEPRYCAYTDYESGSDHPELPRTGEGASGIEARVWDALHDIEDPEMPVSIVDLGLVYGVYVDSASGEARVDMTLTYTGCPARDYLLSSVERAVEDVDGVEDVLVNLLWSPEWSVEMVTEAGREALREFGVSV
jgi:metal-sulfur cluster biosynthetic enzyme